MDIVISSVIILVWTVMREELLNKYWRYTENKHLREFGNGYVVLGCFVCTLVLMMFL